MDLLWISYGFPMGFLWISTDSYGIPHGISRPAASPVERFSFSPRWAEGTRVGVLGDSRQDGESKIDHLPSGDFQSMNYNQW
jgi:hypothetical protein